MTVGEREILFVDPKETDQLIGRVLAGKFSVKLYNIDTSFPDIVAEFLIEFIVLLRVN